MRTSPHPEWIESLLTFLKPYEDRVIEHNVFKALSHGTLPIYQLRRGLINFYPLIERFPRYMALSLAKVPAGLAAWPKATRTWLIRNINQERLHSEWWKNFARGFGVDTSAFESAVLPPAEMDAINHYLWRVCTHGSLAEGVSASNYAIEGPTGAWTKNVLQGLQQYRNMPGVQINEKTLEWISVHAHYDDRHPVEALEIIKWFAITEEEQERVRYAAKRSLEYYALALDDVYRVSDETDH